MVAKAPGVPPEVLRALMVVPVLHDPTNATATYHFKHDKYLRLRGKIRMHDKQQPTHELPG